MTDAERSWLWNRYPEVRELFEEYNGILLEDASAWESLVERCHVVLDKYRTQSAEAAIRDTAIQLEILARKRGE